MSATELVRTARMKRDSGIGKQVRKVLAVVALPIVLIVTWWFSSAGSQNFFFPPLEQIVTAFQPTWFTGAIETEVLPSVWRLLGGYLVAGVIGIGLGALLGSSPVLRAFTEPALEFLRAIPPTVMIPILILFLGIGAEMRVVVIAIGALWPILLNTIEGVRAIDEVLRDTARVYRLTPMMRFSTLILRGASPQIVTGARQGLSVAIILMVISEMFAAQDGIGFTIIRFQKSYAMPEMWSGILLLGVLGIVLSLIFKLFESISLKWYFGLRQSQRGGN
ncbi:ABC-type nitrate/sulfonate/bicarbonate transport system, permease component [Cryobacterium flavum]|uniref:ABC-type nitrate/sulfonate/bicarbonate transport system, permease component n=2 Tax=Cryobacterium flavum TaxID=1424659 RepID=A0A5E9G2R0_9MICO|nr:ABC transporter permease [Cryobacterium flavum]SDO23602.1 ABC-type nitrate/sulfonate/bicarbonate transport system, permease component [Cryobacterium flavum]